MFLREKRGGFPFILEGLFDLEGLGAGAGLLTKNLYFLYYLEKLG
jgi:hypothetical protein